MSHILNRQGADEGAEEDAEDVGEEGHVMERVGGVQQTRNCREQIGEEIHPWKMTFLFVWSIHFYCQLLSEFFKTNDWTGQISI